MEPMTTLENEDVVIDEVQEVVEDIIDTFVPEPKVIYAIENSNGHVTQLVSSVFITEKQLTTAKPIATGEGDNYTHVGEYIKNILGKELFDENGCANFYVDVIQTSSPDESETLTYQLLERPQIDKDAEIASRPQPEKIPTIKEVATALAEVTQSVETLSDAVVEVDNSSSETNMTVEALSDAVVEVDGKTAETLLTVEALTEAVVEVDNKTSVAEAALTERKTDIEIIMDAIVELSEQVAAIQAQLEVK